jgi:hypothetical protein
LRYDFEGIMKKAAVAIISMCAFAIVLPVGARRVDAQVDPCAMLAIGEVRQAFPDSKPGNIERGLEKQGILRCSWESSTGRLFLIASQEPEDELKDEARTWAEAAVDPLRPGAARRMRYEVMPGIGDEAIAVVERRDTANGILEDTALIAVRRGPWLVSLLAPQLARRERADALRMLGELGKATARRLK